MAEEFQIDILTDGTCDEPRLLRPRHESGISWSGEPEALHRLLLGYGTRLPELFETRFGVAAADIHSVVATVQQELAVPLVTAPMPIQDAIDLAEFLVDLTIKFSRFTPGAPTVGGPIEIAAITKHEGFKWIRRKYYYQREFNPEERDGAGQQL